VPLLESLPPSGAVARKYVVAHTGHASAENMIAKIIFLILIHKHLEP